MSDKTKNGVKVGRTGVIIAILAIMIRIILRIDDEVLPIMFNVDELAATLGYVAFWVVFCIVGGRNIRSMKFSRGVAVITLVSALAFGVGIPLVGEMFPIYGCIVSWPRVFFDIILSVLSEPALYTLGGIYYADFLSSLNYQDRYDAVRIVMIIIPLVWYLWSAIAVKRLKKSS